MNSFNGKCVQCGINTLTTADVDGICSMCRMINKSNKECHNPLFEYAGWYCPSCGSVYSPSTRECLRCNPPYEYKITCSCGKEHNHTGIPMPKNNITGQCISDRNIKL